MPLYCCEKFISKHKSVIRILKKTKTKNKQVKMRRPHENKEHLLTVALWLFFVKHIFQV